jgi:hypothetical protein
MEERSFAEILNMPLEEIKTPQALPVGTYLCTVFGQPIFDKVGENQTDCVIFNLKPVQAQGDVDQKQLAEVLNGEALSDRKITHRMFVTDRSKHRIKKFLVDDLGIDPTHSLKQSIEEAMNKQVLVKLSHQPAKDGSAVYENVASTAKV